MTEIAACVIFAFGLRILHTTQFRRSKAAEAAFGESLSLIKAGSLDGSIFGTEPTDGSLGQPLSKAIRSLVMAKIRQGVDVLPLLDTLVDRNTQSVKASKEASRLLLGFSVKLALVFGTAMIARLGLSWAGFLRESPIDPKLDILLCPLAALAALAGREVYRTCVPKYWLWGPSGAAWIEGIFGKLGAAPSHVAEQVSSLEARGAYLGEALVREKHSVLRSWENELDRGFEGRLETATSLAPLFEVATGFLVTLLLLSRHLGAALA